ncbi:MAG TPA: hypothetical protein DF383_00030 [Deltaproteobacteria bacterium]|nr:hypothetical protein [Deltaproteobacteria bacterium]
MPKKKEKYRLQPMLDVKLRNKRQAEINLGKAIRVLKEEEERLKVLEEEKQEIIRKREQARHEMAEMLRMGESVVADSHGHLNFIKRLKEDEEKKDVEIEDQKDTIRRAEDKVAAAKRDYIEACKEVKIMEKHKELWRKKLKIQLEKEEAKQMNELGNISHQLRKMR